MIKLTHGFEEVNIDLSEEKNKTLLGLIKKYKDLLAIGTNIDNLLVNSPNRPAHDSYIPLNSDAIDNTEYIINIKHDGKG